MAIVKINCPPVAAGRVVLGPCRLRQSYYRIVSAKAGAGCIEKFDPHSRAWSPAPESITFGEVWSAPIVPLAAVVGETA
jgi:hypothetical protein